MPCFVYFLILKILMFLFKIIFAVVFSLVFYCSQLCQIQIRIGYRYWRKLFAASSTCRRREVMKNGDFYIAANNSNTNEKFSFFSQVYQRGGILNYLRKKSMLNLYSKCAFLAAKPTRVILSARAILCAYCSICRSKIRA